MGFVVRLCFEVTTVLGPLVSSLFVSTVQAKDIYKNYAELQSHESEGLDYSIRISKRESALTVFAIHGGSIDYGTSTIARSIARDDFSFYFFEGTKTQHNANLHITSANFDEPKALALAKESSHCLSIHGHRNDRKRICVGGNNIAFRISVYEELKAALPQYETTLFCKGLEGINASNIVNRCVDHGVQLEFSSKLRDELLLVPKKLTEVAEAIRKISFIYEKK